MRKEKPLVVVRRMGNYSDAPSGGMNGNCGNSGWDFSSPVRVSEPKVEPTVFLQMISSKNTPHKDSVDIDNPSITYMRMSAHQNAPLKRWQ